MYDSMMTLPETNSLPLKINGLNMKFPVWGKRHQKGLKSEANYLVGGFNPFEKY